MESSNAIEIDEIEPEESVRRAPAWMLAGAVVVAFLLVLLQPTGDLPSTVVGSSTTSPAFTLEPSVTLPPIAVAAAFVDAYGNFNDDLAASFLANDAEVSRLEGGQGHWRLDNRWLEAVGFKLDLVSCESMGSSASGVRVHCEYAFHALGSDAADLGPFEGWFDLRVRDGRIVWAFQTWHPGAFIEQVWEPFTDWVAKTHPGDVKVMYTGGQSPLFTEKSIALWKQRVDEYRGSPEALFLSQVHSICETATERFEQAGGTSDIEMDTPTYQIAHRISVEALAELRALSPSNESGTLAEIFSLMEQQTDVLGQIAEAAASGDRALVETLSRRRVELTHAKDNRGGPDFWNCPLSLPA